MWGLSLVAASGGHSSSRCTGLSLSWPLLLRSTGSRRAGSVVVAHGPSCSVATRIFPDQGSNPCPLHRQADSQPLRHQGSPGRVFLTGANWERLGPHSCLLGKLPLQGSSCHFLSLGYKSSWLSQHLSKHWILSQLTLLATGRKNLHEQSSVYFHLCLQTAVSLLSFSLFQDLAKCGEKTTHQHLHLF